MARQNIQGDIWADTGTKTDPGDVKTALGYVAEKPPFQTENWKSNRTDQMLAHIEEFGMPEWDALTVYNINSYSLGSDGKIYKSLQNANQNHDAISSPSWWAEAFLDRTTAQTVTGEKTFDALKLGANANANDKKIVNLAAPTSNKDGANKAYIDGLIPTGLTGGNDSAGETKIGELEIKWGKITSTILGNNTVTFVTPFSNNCFQVYPVMGDTSVPGDADPVSGHTLTASSFQVHVNANYGTGKVVRWFAIGR